MESDQSNLDFGAIAVVSANYAEMPKIVMTDISEPDRPLKSNIPRSVLRAQNYWGFQRGLNIPFGRERGLYP
ncbi:MAG: hypothetical protein ACXW6J_09970, partial [Candidatus Binatia bacterium]